MPTAFPKLFRNLTRPFAPDDYRTLRLDDGREVWLPTTAALRGRLDRVFGPERWTDEYIFEWRGNCTIRRAGHGWHVSGPLPRIVAVVTLLMPDGRRVAKRDVGSVAGPFVMPRTFPVNPIRAGMDDAFRRACLKWGLGRKVTYRIESPRAVPRQEVQDDAPCDPEPPVDSGHVPPIPDATRIILDALARPPANLPDFLDFLHRATKATGDDIMKMYLRWHVKELIPGKALALPAELVPAAFDYIVTRLREDAIP